MAIEMIEEFDLGTQIKVIGIGGGAGTTCGLAMARGAARRVRTSEARCTKLVMFIRLSKINAWVVRPHRAIFRLAPGKPRI